MVAPVPGRAVHAVNAGPGALCQLYAGPDEAGVPVEAAEALAIVKELPAQAFVFEMEPGLWVVEKTLISVVVDTVEPQPKVARLWYLYVPGVARVSVNVSPEPVRFVHAVKPGPGALLQLYVGPVEAGVPVDAAVMLFIVIGSPGQTSFPSIDPALCDVE